MKTSIENLQEVWLRTLFLSSSGDNSGGVRVMWQGTKQDPLWFDQHHGKISPILEELFFWGVGKRISIRFNIRNKSICTSFVGCPVLTRAECPTKVPRNQCLAETLSFYHTVKRLGIPDSQIILMMAEAPHKPRCCTTQNDFGCLEMSDRGLQPSLC